MPTDLKVISHINYNGQTYSIYDESGRFAAEGHHHGLDSLDGITIANNYNANTNPIATVSTVSAAVNNITAESLGLSRALKFIGFATVDIEDGSTTDPQISGYTTKSIGDVVISRDSQYEFVWTAAGMWEQLGPDGSFIISGATAIDVTPTGTIANTGTIVNYTPTGTLDTQIFHGAEGYVNVTGVPTGTITITSTATSAGNPGNYTPSGTVSASFTTKTLTTSVGGSTGDITIAAHSYTPGGSITSSTSGTGTANYAPTGTISTTFTTTTMVSVGAFTPSGTVNRTANVALTTTDVTVLTGVGTMPDLTMDVTNEKLTYGWSSGGPVQTTQQTVATGISTQPTFSFSGTQDSVEVFGTTVDSIASTFFGDNTYLTFSGTATSLAHTATSVPIFGTATYTTLNTIAATFSGNAIRLLGTFTGSDSPAMGTFTPTGTIDTAVFHGVGAKLVFIGDTQHITIN